MRRNFYLFNLRVFLGGISVLLFLILTGSFGYTAPISSSKEIDKPAKTKIQKAYGKLPLYFIRNNGQVDGKVKFYEKGNGHATFFTKEGVYLALGKRLEAEGTRLKGQGKSQEVVSFALLGESPEASDSLRRENRQTINLGKNPKAQPVIASDQRKRSNLKSEITRNSKPATHMQLIKLSLLGANKDPEIIAEDQQQGKVNYFIGNDPEKWRTGIPTYRAVVYKEIYPGIDMKFYGNNRELEYDIIVSPGADPSTVRLSYEGIESLRVTEEGELEIGIKGGKILQKRPYIYQVIDGKKGEVDGKFVIKKDVIASDQREPDNLKDEIALPSARNDRNLGFEYGFDVDSYDKAHPIIIDPVLVYSTYLSVEAVMTRAMT